MTTLEHVYRVVEVVRVVDADTLWAKLDIGFRNTLLVNIRLDGYDCPERRKGSFLERAEAIRAVSVATEFLAPVVPHPGSTLWVQTKPDPDDFGRWLGVVWREHGDTIRYLGAELRAVGLASIWPTRWHTEFDPEAAR